VRFFCFNTCYLKSVTDEHYEAADKEVGCLRALIEHAQCFERSTLYEAERSRALHCISSTSDNLARFEVSIDRLLETFLQVFADWRIVL
jgi:hypothetical protein